MLLLNSYGMPDLASVTISKRRYSLLHRPREAGAKEGV
jgi:hypothetical protein